MVLTNSVTIDTRGGAGGGIGGDVSFTGTVNADDNTTADRSLTVQLPVGGVRTVYARVGDGFAWLCVAALAVLLVVTIAGRTRSSLGSTRVSTPNLATMAESRR